VRDLEGLEEFADGIEVELGEVGDGRVGFVSGKDGS